MKPNITPSRLKEYRAAYYQRNREAIRARAAARYVDNPGPAKERAQKWLKDNPDRALKRKAAYREIHKQELNDKQMARYWANRAEHMRKNAERRVRNRQKNRAYARHKAAVVTEGYAREQLAKYSPIHAWEFPTELVAVKVASIKLKREIRNKSKCKT